MKQDLLEYLRNEGAPINANVPFERAKNLRSFHNDTTGELLLPINFKTPGADLKLYVCGAAYSLFRVFIALNTTLTPAFLRHRILDDIVEDRIIVTERKFPSFLYPDDHIFNPQDEADQIFNGRLVVVVSTLTAAF